MELALRIIKYIDMFNKRKFQQVVYSSPEVDVIDLMTENVLCMSFSEDGTGAGNTGDGFVEGDKWEDLFS